MQWMLCLVNPSLLTYLQSTELCTDFPVNYSKVLLISSTYIPGLLNKISSRMVSSGSKALCNDCSISRLLQLIPNRKTALESFERKRSLQPVHKTCSCRNNSTQSSTWGLDCICMASSRRYLLSASKWGQGSEVSHVSNDNHDKHFANRCMC